MTFQFWSMALGLALTHLVHKNPDLDFLTIFKFLIIHLHLSGRCTHFSTEKTYWDYSISWSHFKEMVQSIVWVLVINLQSNVPGTGSFTELMFWSTLHKTDFICYLTPLFSWRFHSEFSGLCFLFLCFSISPLFSIKHLTPDLQSWPVASCDFYIPSSESITEF